jgi:tartrate dehydratase alpha subunit/fumarate hydratase class I-like protein
MRITKKDFIKAIKRADREIQPRYSPTVVHKLKKTYKRREKHKEDLLQPAEKHEK